ncbi:unnamed protein product [Closterium sp. Naga37s-1]|nr:unnamed protein product [Closterium sp. Naga37s-1]
MAGQLHRRVPPGGDGPSAGPHVPPLGPQPQYSAIQYWRRLPPAVQPAAALGRAAALAGHAGVLASAGSGVQLDGGFEAAGGAAGSQGPRGERVRGVFQQPALVDDRE